MDIFKFQTNYLNALEDEKTECGDFKQFIKDNNESIFDILYANLNNPRYRTLISILFNDFKDIYQDQICNRFLPYYITFTQTIINEFDGTLEEYNEIYCDLHLKLIREHKFYKWSSDLLSQITQNNNAIFFNNDKMIDIIKMCFDEENYKPIYELLLKMTGNLSNKLYTSINNIILEKLNNTKNIHKLIVEFNNHKIFNDNNKKEIISRYTRENIKTIFKELVINENDTYTFFLDYINNSDTFIENYKRFLVKKAVPISRSKTNTLYHKKLIKKCNVLNFIDSNHCNKILEESNSYIGFYSTQVEILIGTYGIWPLKSSHQSICKAFEPTKKIFDDLHKKENKKISWVYDEMTAEIEFNNYLLIVPIIMVDYILQFNVNDNDNNGIEKCDSNIEKFLVKMKILKIKNNKIVCNDNFKYKSKRVDLMTKYNIMKRNNTKSVSNKKINIIDIEYYLDSKIVKLLKKHREMNKEKMLEGSDFRDIDQSIIDKRISSLESRDFIKVQENNIIEYIP